MLPKLRDDSRLGQCNWTITNIQSVLFVKKFSYFFGRAESNPFFININPKGCHYYRIDSIAERGTQNG
jgi:hypothetical protein